MSKQTDLAKKVGLYIQRATRARSDIPFYPLEEEGVYRVIGGTVGNRDRYEIKELFEGKFIDAIVFALQQPNFYAEWCSSDNPDNVNHGYVEKVTIKKLEDLK